MAARSTQEETVATRSGQLELLREDVAELLAHDLRTPLAAIAMNVDFALSELDDPPPSVRGALEDCCKSTQTAMTLVADMVDAMQLASGELRLDLADVDVQPLIAGAARAVAPEAAARGVRLVWTAEPSIVRADAGLLERALRRVLERALRHARSGGSIDVTLRGGSVVVRVRSADAMPVVVEAGVRALATHFADAVLRAHGGAVWIESDTDDALLFCVALPP
jgi:signal transduction histidine kinase